MSTKPNRMLSIVQKAYKLPAGLRQTILSKAFGMVVPMVGTAGIKYEEVTPEKVIVSIKNHRGMQNHIKSVHAVAIALLAETATGFVVAMNIPDGCIVLIKSMKVDYKRLVQGDMRAVATLSLEQRELMQQTPKGEIQVPVVITDATGQSPVEATMIWAWVSKKKS